MDQPPSVATLLVRPRPAGCFWPLRGVVLPNWDQDVWPALDDEDPSPRVYLVEAEVIVPQWRADGATPVAPGILGVGELAGLSDHLSHHVRDVPGYCNGGLLVAVASGAACLARIAAALARADVSTQSCPGIGDPAQDRWPWPGEAARAWIAERVTRHGEAFVSAVDGCGVVMVADPATMTRIEATS